MPNILKLIIYFVTFILVLAIGLTLIIIPNIFLNILGIILLVVFGCVTIDTKMFLKLFN